MPTDYAIKNGRTVMDATLYTGTGTTAQNVVNTAGFKPDLVWVKNKGTATDHQLIDSVRGVNIALQSNQTNAEANFGSMPSFNSNGFQVVAGGGGAFTGTNNSGSPFVGWQWQAGQGTTTTNNVGSISSQVSVNATAGFSIVTYTGNGTASTVGHGLGVAPSFMLVKCRSNVNTYWIAYQATLGGTKGLYLNTNDSVVTTSVLWNNTAPTSSVLTLGISSDVNNSGFTYVAYCWAQVAGFSQFGSYTGNGSADGPFVYTGFRPKFILIKRTDAVSDWEINDSSRNTYNVANLALYPDLSAAETSTYAYKDLLSNGFKIRTTDGNSNTSGGTYIYAAFAENPFKYANAR